MNYIKVKDKDYLLRDVESNGIINNDDQGYQAYAENYKRVYNESKRIKNLENDVNDIKSDLNEIKNLLRGLANGS
jgi:predicted transcriptional regulator